MRHRDVDITNNIHNYPTLERHNIYQLIPNGDNTRMIYNYTIIKILYGHTTCKTRKNKRRYITIANIGVKLVCS